MEQSCGITSTRFDMHRSTPLPPPPFSFSNLNPLLQTHTDTSTGHHFPDPSLPPPLPPAGWHTHTRISMRSERHKQRVLESAISATTTDSPLIPALFHCTCLLPATPVSSVRQFANWVHSVECWNVISLLIVSSLWRSAASPVRVGCCRGFFFHVCLCLSVNLC